MTDLDFSQPINPNGHHLWVGVPQQSMRHYLNGELQREYRVSTAKNGTGCEQGSYKTPTGWHKVRVKIGNGCPKGTIFVARRPKNKLFNQEMLQAYPDKDWILTRILWLSGLELGKNRLGNVDTMQRYVYIHGMANEANIGHTNSKGCINMLNDDIIELFDNIPINTTVYIEG